MPQMLVVCLLTAAAAVGQIQVHENGDEAALRSSVFREQTALHNIQRDQRKSGSSFTGAVGTLHGKLKQLSDKVIEIETQEDHIILIRRTHKTKFFKNCEPIKATDIDLETAIAIDVRTAGARLLGVNVSVDSSPEQAFVK